MPPAINIKAPISELIVQDVVRTLKKIRLGAAWGFDLIVEREEKDGNSPRHGLVVVVVGGAMPQPNPPMMHDEYHLPIAIVSYAMVSELWDLPIASVLSQLAADIRKALKFDLHRGGLACNTIFESADQFETVDPAAHVIVNVQVHFRTLQNDPYTR